MKKYIISVDNGGTYIKAGIYDFKGRQLGLVKHYNHLISERVEYTEYNPDELWATNCRCMHDVIEQTNIVPSEIAVIGISGQGSGCYFMGAHGETIRNFISSADRRAQYIVEKWRKAGTLDKLYPYLFQYPASGQTFPILAWLKENEPENYRQIRWIFSMKDYLSYRFTGEINFGRGCMSVSGLYNMQRGEFDPMLANMLGLPDAIEKLSTPKWDIEIAGFVSESAAKECGCLAGTPVAAGSHDVIATAFAMGCIDPTYCFTIMGTCAINGYISPIPFANHTIRYNELFAFPGMYLIEEPGSASSSILEWVIDILFDRNKSSIENIYKEINSMVEHVDPLSSNLLFIPYLRGHNDIPSAKGAWIGLDHDHSRSEMLTAVYESIVFSHMTQLEQLFANRNIPERIRVGGGAINSDVWMQMFADAVGIPIEIVPNQEMGTKGAAVVAAIAAGIYPDPQTAIQEMNRPGIIIHPRPEYTAIYMRKYARFKTVMQKLTDIWPEFERRI